MTFLENIISSIPLPDYRAMELAKTRMANAYPGVYFGAVIDLVAKFIGITGNLEPTIPKKAIVIMAGDHGVANQGVSAYPQEVTAQMVCNYLSGGAGVNILARHAGADLFVVDVGIGVQLKEHEKLIQRKIAYGTKDFTQEPAMSAKEAIQAIQTGIEVAHDCAKQGYRLLGMAEMGIGNTTASAAIASVYTGIEPEKMAGRGSGIGDGRLKLKIAVIKKAIELHKPDRNCSMDVLTKIGGFDIAAMAGFIIGGAQCKIPIVVDGVIATAAALIAVGLAPRCREYLIPSHLSAEPAHQKMLEMLGIKPGLTMDMCLGEGTGAALGMKMLDVGISLYCG